MGGLDELARHRIAAVRTLPVSVSFVPPRGPDAREPGGRGLTSQIRVLTTDRGAQGWGHSLGKTADASRILDRSVAELFEPDRGVVAPELAPFDFALHDLAGVILGVPVWRLLGAQGAPSLVAYDGSITMDDIGLPLDEGLARLAARCQEGHGLGHRAFKLKVGRGRRWMPADDGLRRDIEVTRFLRRRFPECRLLVDANDGFTCEQALDYVRAVADCELFWIEEPFPESAPDLERLRRVLEQYSPRTLIADGETNFDVPQLVKLAAAGLVDVLLMDIGRLGLTPWRRIIREAGGGGLGFSPHTCCNPLKIVYAAHLLAGTGTTAPLEAFAADCDVVSQRLSFTEGSLALSSAPGFGLTLAADRS
jgi:D-galactarolactone cycloisomerase